jgi:hypothetical protein
MLAIISIKFLPFSLALPTFDVLYVIIGVNCVAYILLAISIGIKVYQNLAQKDDAQNHKPTSTQQRIVTIVWKTIYFVITVMTLVYSALITIVSIFMVVYLGYALGNA